MYQVALKTEVCLNNKPELIGVDGKSRRSASMHRSRENVWNQYCSKQSAVTVRVRVKRLGLQSVECLMSTTVLSDGSTRLRVGSENQNIWTAVSKTLQLCAETLHINGPACTLVHRVQQRDNACLFLFSGALLLIFLHFFPLTQSQSTASHEQAFTLPLGVLTVSSLWQAEHGHKSNGPLLLTFSFFHSNTVLGFGFPFPF